jgi:hypothetical protein
MGSPSTCSLKAPSLAFQDIQPDISLGKPLDGQKKNRELIGEVQLSFFSSFYIIMTSQLKLLRPSESATIFFLRLSMVIVHA